MAYGNFIKRFCTIGWAFVGLIAAAMVAQNVVPGAVLRDPEDAFGFACHHLLFPGALGLLIASVLAANMSTCSAFMVDSGALFTQGFYRRYLAPGREDRHYLWVGRFSGFGITMLGVLYALFLIEKVLYTFLLSETMATYMGISLMGGLVWRRANRCLQLRNPEKRSVTFLSAWMSPRTIRSSWSRTIPHTEKNTNWRRYPTQSIKLSPERRSRAGTSFC